MHVWVYVCWCMCTNTVAFFTLHAFWLWVNKGGEKICPQSKTISHSFDLSVFDGK